MKKLVFLIASGFVMLTPLIYGQTPNVANNNQPTQKQKKARSTPEQRAQRSAEALDRIVGLSTDQKNKIYNLALERSKSVDAVLIKYQGQAEKKEQAKSEIYEIRKKYRQEVKNILTPEQIDKLKQHNKAVKPKPSGSPEDIIPDEKTEG